MMPSFINYKGQTNNDYILYHYANQRLLLTNNDANKTGYQVSSLLTQLARLPLFANCNQRYPACACLS